MATFKNLDPNGTRTFDVEYTPLNIKVGDTPYRFALHKIAYGWVVSDPVSGGRVCDVPALYKGIARVTSSHLGPREAAKRAKEHLAEFVEKVSPEGFNQRLAQARQKWARAAE
jgi:hypothetical protein